MPSLLVTQNVNTRLCTNLPVQQQSVDGRVKKPRTVGSTHGHSDSNSSLSRDNLLDVEVITDMDDFLFQFPSLVYHFLCECMLVTR